MSRAVVKPGTMEMKMKMETEMEIEMQVCNGSSPVPRPPSFFRIHEMGIRLGTSSRLQWQGLWTLDFTMGKGKKHSTLP